MKFLDIKFPDEIASGSSGGPEFSTSIATMKNKNEIRNRNWAEPRFKYSIFSGIKSKEDYEKVKSFFMICGGMEYSFRFKDFADFEAKNQQIAIGDGSKKSFNLIKNYSFGNLSINRKISKPILGTVKIFLDSIEQTTGFLIDYQSGIIDFTNPLSQNTKISADFQFDVQARFNIDYLPAKFEEFNNITFQEISLIEVKN